VKSRRGSEAERKKISINTNDLKLEAVKNIPLVTPHKCIETAALHKDIKTQICVKSPSVDRLVSGGILETGVWEGDIVTEVMRSMNNYPEAVFMDIGANIGR